MERFTHRILKWYDSNARDLPWRRTSDPYLIWVSETILQQTRVAQGVGYYQRFVETFPSVQNLAEAEEDVVLKVWQGLGYYSRARNMHVAARQIMERGAFPDSYDELLQLKGVGRYTAAAICAFAFHYPVAVVDGNVYRVLSRFFGVDTPIDTSKGQKVFVELAASCLASSNPAKYNSAIMDFGALCCTPSAPHCDSCPLNDSCVALASHAIDKLPVKGHKVKVSHRFFNYFFVRSGPYTFLNRRVDDDVWRNLYEFPLIETSMNLTEEELVRTRAFHAMFSTFPECTLRCRKLDFRHVLTHRVIHANLYEVVLPDDCVSFNSFERIKMDDLHKFPVSRLVNHFFSLLLPSD